MVWYHRKRAEDLAQKCILNPCLFILGTILEHPNTDTSYLRFCLKKAENYPLPPPAHHVHSDLIQWINIIHPLTMLKLTEAIPLSQASTSWSTLLLRKPTTLSFHNNHHISTSNANSTAFVSKVVFSLHITVNVGSSYFKKLALLGRILRDETISTTQPYFSKAAEWLAIFYIRSDCKQWE